MKDNSGICVLRARQYGLATSERLAYFAMLYEHIRPNITKDGFLKLLEADCLRSFYEKAHLNGKYDNDRVLAEFMQVVLTHVGAWCKYLIREAEEELGGKITTKKQFLKIRPKQKALGYPPLLNTLPFLVSSRWFYQLGKDADPEKLKRCFFVEATSDVSTEINFGDDCSSYIALVKTAVMNVELARHTGSQVRRRDYDDSIEWYFDLQT